MDDTNPGGDRSAEPHGASRKLQEGMKDVDPTGRSGRPVMVSGFIIVLLLVLAAMLVIGLVVL